MGSVDSKISSDDEVTTDQDSNSGGKIADFDEDSEEFNRLNRGRTVDDKKEETTVPIDDTEADFPDGSSLKTKNLPALFSKYLEDVKNKLDESDDDHDDDDDDDDEEDEEEKFEFSTFLNCSPSEMSACQNMLIDFHYQNFDITVFSRNVLYEIFINSRYRIQTKTAYLTAFNEIFEREKEKIQKNSNWSDVVMFGAILVRLLFIHDPDIFLATEHMKVWILELIKSSVEGNENALIAYMLIMKRLRGLINPYRGSYIQFVEVLLLLLKNGDCESKSREVFEYLEHCSKFDDHVNIVVLNYRRETKDSTKCKFIKEFLTSDDEQTLFDINQLAFITPNEIKYFAKEFIKVIIQKPQKIKFFAATAYRIQKTINVVQRIATDVKEDIEHEIKIFKNNEGKSIISIITLAKFIGEVSIHMGLVPTELLTSWLMFLSEMGETVALTATLKVNGWFYKLRQPEKFEKFLKSLGIFASEVDEEVAKVSEVFKKIENWDSEDITKYKISRHFKPADDARIIEDLELFLSEISKDKNVGYNFQKLFDHKNFYSFNARKPILRELSKPSANVIKLAQFLKTFCTISSNVATFIRELKRELNHKIAEMPVDRPQEIICIGKLICELRNLTVTDKLPQDKWTCMIESLEPDKDNKILEIHLEVLKVMMFNLYMYEEDKHRTFVEYIQSIDLSDPKYPKKIKSKVYQMSQNFIHKTLNKSSRSLLFRIKSGYKIDSLPYDIPDTCPTEFDLSDFVKLFFVNATMNRYFMYNFFKSMKILTRGSRGQTFDNLLYSLAMDRYKNMLNPEYFDEDDAIATLQFILLFYPQNFFGQHSFTTFLEDNLAFEEFEAHKSCFKVLLKMIKTDPMFRDFLKRKDQDSKVFKLLRKIHVKFIDLQDSAANETEEVEIWHIVDYQGYGDDQDSPKSEASQLVWSFTENYKENQEKMQKMLEDSKQSEQKVDVLAQKLKDYSQNYQEPQYSRFDSRYAPQSQNLHSTRGAQNSAQSLRKSDKIPPKSAFKIQILPDTSRYSAPVTNYNRQYQNYDRRNQNTKIEWNVTRDSLKDRNALHNAESKIFKK